MYINPIDKPLTEFHRIASSSFYNFREGTALDVAKRVAILAAAPIAYVALAFLYLAFQAFSFFAIPTTQNRSPANVVGEIYESIISKIRTIGSDIQTDFTDAIKWPTKQIRSVQVFINYTDDVQPPIQRDYILNFTAEDYAKNEVNGADNLKKEALDKGVDPIKKDLEQLVKYQDYTFKLLVLVKDSEGYLAYARDEMSGKGSAYSRKPEIILGTPKRNVHTLCESLLSKMGRQMTPEFLEWLV